MPYAWRSFTKLITRFINHEYARRSWGKLHPIRASIKDRWPRFYRLLARRLRYDRFTGLPLALLVLATLYLIAATVGWITDVLHDPDVTEFDIMFNESIQPIRTDDLLIVLRWLTHLAHSATLVAVAVTASGFIVAKKLWNYLLPMWLVVVGAIGMTWAFKYWFMRARPDVMADVSEWSPSFPSGHATGAVAVYGFVAYIIARELTSSAQRVRLAYLTVLLIATIAASRMLLSVHFFSDIVVGLLIGGFWLLMGYAIREYIAAK